MIANALNKVSYEFGIKETHRQFHHLQKKISNKRDVHTSTDMKQYPSPYKINYCTANRQHQLRNQNEPYNLWGIRRDQSK